MNWSGLRILSGEHLRWLLYCETIKQVIFAGREVEWSDGCLGQQEHRYGALCSEGRLAILDMNNRLV